MTEKKKKHEVKEESKATKITIDELANFCKREGFVFRSSDIYGGLSGFWDFGPLGIELFNNIKQSWWNYFVHGKENIVGMEASIISHPKIWQASGHVANFNVNDYLVVCTKCKKSNKVDKPDLRKIKCECGGEYNWDNAKIVEQMFKTKVGTDQIETYLRGETAQGMFTDFRLIQQTSRKQLPFGIAQLGRCFRNEVAPRDFMFRCREFHIAEFEFFINPEEKKCDLLTAKHLNLKVKLLDAETQVAGKDTLKETTIGKMLKDERLEEWHAYWLAEQVMWFRSIGLEDELKIREHKKDELSHYSSATFDLDYNYPFGSKEIAGIANRGQFDLTQHANASKEKMEIFDEKYKNKLIPKVIEPTFGMERVFLAILTNAHQFDEERQNIVLKIPAKLAPIKASIFPIIKEEKFEVLARKVFDDLKEQFYVSYDISGSIGRRYARNDEIGTPMCITIDGDSVDNGTVTIRDRDSTKQVRVDISELKSIMQKVINGDNLLNFGKVVETRVKE